MPPHAPRRNPPEALHPFRFFATLLLLLPLLSPAHAQPVGVPLSDEVLRIDELGMVVALPENASAQAVPGSETVAARITPDRGTWTITIQTPRARAAETTPDVLATQVLEQLEAAYAVVSPQSGRRERTEARLINRFPDLLISGRPAERFYISLPSGPAGKRMLHGYTFLQVTGSRFVVFELITPEENTDLIQRVYETVVASTRFVDPLRAEADRGKAVMRGLEVLSSIPSSEYERILSDIGVRWERLHTPSPTGRDADAVEHGYRRIRAWKGQRGEIDPRQSPDEFTGIEQDEGYLLSMDVRFLQAGAQTTDIFARYFVSPDFSQEAWTIQMTLRDGARVVGTYGETGVREGTSIKVAIDSPGQPPMTVRPLIQGPGYIGQVRSYMLPELLATAGVPGEFAFYAYRTTEQGVFLRRDTLEPITSRDGGWRVTSTLQEGELPQTTILDRNNRFVRTTLPNAKVWERTSLDDLVRIWKSKNLPMN
ncbi:MAG: hypothetical protein ACF8SC_00995 [Phycisphaerales bacterium JB037]